MLTAIQIAINTPDMAGSLRFYSELFGFRNAGGTATWGSIIGAQGLPAESRAIQWFLVGTQEFFQLEFFEHTLPRNRPLREDWRPSDLGWTRFGLRIDEFDRRWAALSAWGIELITQPSTKEGRRHVAFFDPLAGAIVELIEAQAGEPAPAAIYATSSVADLDAARNYYEETIGLPTRPLEHLHDPSDETLWGLDGAGREGFLVDAGNLLLEIVRYDDPLGRPRPADYRLSDQGIVNIALGSYEAAEAMKVIKRIQDRGLTIPKVVNTNGVAACLVTDPGYELEIAGLPKEIAKIFGFEAVFPFLDQAL